MKEAYQLQLLTTSELCAYLKANRHALNGLEQLLLERLEDADDDLTCAKADIERLQQSEVEV